FKKIRCEIGHYVVVKIRALYKKSSHHQHGCRLGKCAGRIRGSRPNLDSASRAVDAPFSFRFLRLLLAPVNRMAWSRRHSVRPTGAEYRHIVGWYRQAAPHHRLIETKPAGSGPRRL